MSSGGRRIEDNTLEILAGGYIVRLYSLQRRDRHQRRVDPPGGHVRIAHAGDIDTGEVVAYIGLPRNNRDGGSPTDLAVDEIAGQVGFAGGTSLREHLHACGCRNCHPRWSQPVRPDQMHASRSINVGPNRSPPAAAQRWLVVLLRLAYLGVTNAFTLLRLLPMSDRTKDVEILTLRHQITVLERQLHGDKARFTTVDRAFLAALLHRLPRQVLRRFRLLVRPETVLRWHRDLIRRRHAAISRPRQPGRPPTVRSIRVLALRLARENNSWGYRRIHGELLTLGITVAASTVWQILKDAGIDPAPDRTSMTWAAFLRSQAEAIISADFFETVTLTATRRIRILGATPHATRRIRILGATPHPTAAWVTQTIRNLVMDLDDAGCRFRYIVRDRDGKYPALIDAILADASIQTVLTGVRMPRMNSLMERWIQTCRHELLDRTLILNQAHLMHALREYEIHYNAHRTHRSIAGAAPLRPLPQPIDPGTSPLRIHRHDRLGGLLHEYQHAA